MFLNGEKIKEIYFIRLKDAPQFFLKNSHIEGFYVLKPGVFGALVWDKENANMFVQKTQIGLEAVKCTDVFSAVVAMN